MGETITKKEYKELLEEVGILRNPDIMDAIHESNQAKRKAVILEKSSMSIEEIDTLFSIVMGNINIIPEEDVKAKMKQVMDIMKDIDPNDAPFIAAALTIPNNGIWSHDRHFEKQRKVKRYLAKDLLKYI